MYAPILYAIKFVNSSLSDSINKFSFQSMILVHPVIGVATGVREAHEKNNDFSPSTQTLVVISISEQA